MQLVSSLRNREINYGGRFGGHKSLSLSFALHRLRSPKEDILKKMDMIVPPFACQFCKVIGFEAVAAVSTEDGDILLLDTSKKPGSRVLTSWQAHNNAAFDISWYYQEQKLISVSGDHTAALWDVLEKKCVSVFPGHSGTVKTVDICPTQNAVFATGSRDGSIRVWDARSPKKGDNFHEPENVIQTAHAAPCLKPKSQQRHKRPVISSPLSSVTSLVFQNERQVISSGVTDGVIKVWDLRKTYCSYKKQPKPQYQLLHGKSKIHGFTSLAMDSSRTQLYGCCTDSNIYHYDCHTYNEHHINSYCGLRSSSYFIKIAVSGDDKYLASGSGDQFAYIWELSKPSLPIVQLPGHTDEVTAVAWSPVDFKLISCGDDEQVLLWDILFDQEQEDLENTVHYSAIPFDSSKSQRPILGESSVHHTGVPNSASPTMLPRHSPIPKSPAVKNNAPKSLSVKNNAPKSSAMKNNAPKSSSLSITQWFSPSDSLNFFRRSQNCTSENIKVPSSDQAGGKKAITDFPSANTLSKKRKSDEFEKMGNTEENVSPNKVHFHVDNVNLSPSEKSCVGERQVLSPSKINCTNERVLSPIKSDSMTNALEVNNAKRSLNLTSLFKNKEDIASLTAESCHKIVQNLKNKENVCSSDVSSRSLDASKDCMLKKSTPGSSKAVTHTSLISVVRKVSKGNKISKKASKHTSKEQKKKLERSIESYFSISPSGSRS